MVFDAQEKALRI